MDSQHATPAPVAAPSAHTKQYVFVDEYNRHKRLKVMRACDGCRKRKIRCDGALQNGPWPCGACVRLKLKCVPPSLDAEDDFPTPDSNIGQTQFSFQNTTINSSGKPTDSRSHPQMIPEWAAGVVQPVTSTESATAPLQGDLGHGSYASQYFGQQQFGTPLQPGYPTESYLTPASSRFQPDVPHNSLMRTQTDASSSTTGEPQDLDATVKELSEHMGDLSIEISSQASYITNEKKLLAETPAEEEPDIILPPSVGSGTTVRIPPEMMPSDERVLDYLGYFFDYIHPYVPVLNRSAFYEQWRTARHSISPLILEGIFACVARYLEQPYEVRRWLALASKHEENFKDVPRLSTIQAMILLTKAREVIPKRGYYYRSWMAVKYMSTMAFDLGLHEHSDQHRTDACKLSKADCMVRTRIWQNIFILEILIGAPLGRSDFAVEPETVDFSVPIKSPEIDAFEYSTSRRFTFMAQNFRNIKKSNSLWHAMKRIKKDWALDPAFTERNEGIAAWVKQLPEDMQITMPEDGSPPYLGGDHFVAYVHVYHQLVVIMHHRPQLQTMLEMKDEKFKKHLDLCLESASNMCRIQEALIRDFGLHGLQWMLRGVNFTIYCVLTCTMLHLAAITSPDPVQNSQARMYFERHMRVLEHCIPGANAQMQAQIDALREAFSADITKPFELKPSLGLRSPSMDNHLTPPDLQDSPQSVPAVLHPSWSIQATPPAKPTSPRNNYSTPYNSTGAGLPSPSNLGYHTASYHAPNTTTYSSQSLNQTTSNSQNGYALEPAVSNSAPIWDPSGIFNQWNTAFGGQSNAPQAQSQVADSRIGHSSKPLVSPHQPSVVHSALYSPQTSSSNPGALVPEPVIDLPTVTPMMWQDAFTNAYVSGHGQKRYRELSAEPPAYDQYSKRRG